MQGRGEPELTKNRLFTVYPGPHMVTDQYAHDHQISIMICRQAMNLNKYEQQTIYSNNNGGQVTFKK